MSQAWMCPYCNHHTIIGNEKTKKGHLFFDNGNKDGPMFLAFDIVICPNPVCNEYTISAALHEALDAGPRWDRGNVMRLWQLRPQSSALPFPDYIPAPLREDYEEACLIRDLSPKASATLSRRCLQGMIRDFYGAKERTLFDEINAIKDKVDPAIWQAINAVRSIGNIGAHMEKDINLVIDVDPDEAQALIQLIEVLFEEWYVARQQRTEHLASIVAIANAKKALKNPNTEGA